MNTNLIDDWQHIKFYRLWIISQDQVVQSYIMSSCWLIVLVLNYSSERVFFNCPDRLQCTEFWPRSDPVCRHATFRPSSSNAWIKCWRKALERCWGCFQADGRTGRSLSTPPSPTWAWPSTPCCEEKIWKTTMRIVWQVWLKLLKCHSHFYWKYCSLEHTDISWTLSYEILLYREVFFY